MSARRRSHNPSKRGHPFMSHASSRRSRLLLLSGASLVTLLAAQPTQAQVLSAIKPTVSSGSSSSSGAVQGSFGVAGPRLVTAESAAQAAQKAQAAAADFNTAVNAVAVQLAAQAQARTVAAQAPSSVPDGLAAGGLVPHDNPSQADVANGLVWLNANAPTETTSGGQTTVTIQQTAQKAILTWDSFNVGKNTTVHFDQSAGTQKSDGSNQWIALNRVEDPSAAPSQILGQIKAEGSVYLINRNGVIFGGSSQVNVHSLIVSTLPILAGFDGTGSITSQNNLFLTYGVAATGEPSNLLGTDTGNHFDGDSGAIDIQQGAHIETGEGGYSLIAAPTLTNEGEIVANGGAVTLAATRGLGGSPTSPTNAGFAPFDNNAAVYTLVNTGSITSVAGSVNLLGTNVDQNGLVVARTSISQPGSIGISAEDEVGGGDFRPGAANFGVNSVTAILPDEDGETTTSSAAATADFKPGSVGIFGGNVYFQSNSLLEAPGAGVGITASNAAEANPIGAKLGIGVYLDASAVLDVAGLANVQLPMSDNLVTVPRVGQNELADSPVQRNGVLYTAPITVDARLSGTRGDGEAWVGTPVANVGSYVQDVPRDIDQMLVNGGSISFNAEQVITAPGSQINLSGGYVHYAGGYVQTTRLLGADGKFYDIADADPNMTYVGLVGVDTVTHARWGVTQSYTNSLLIGGHWESDYVQGGDGGSLNLFLAAAGSGTFGAIPTSEAGGGSAILNGAIYAGAVTGRYQTGAGNEPTAGTFNLTDAGINITTSGVSLDNIAPNFTYTTSLATPDMLAKSPSDPTNVLSTTNLSSTLLDNAGFSTLEFTADKITLASSAALSVTPGGLVSMTAGRLDILGSITAHSGHITLISTGQTGTSEVSSLGLIGGASDVIAPITLSAQGQITAPVAGDITVGPNSTLDVSGQWVNDAWQGIDQRVGDAFVNGGSITIQTQARLERGLGAIANFPVGAFNTTGDIILSPGSVLNASSGGYVGPTGVLETKNGLPVGQGGNITLQTYVTPGTSTFLMGDVLNGAAPLTQGTVQLGGTLKDYGFAGGGVLTIQTPGLQIGGAPSSAPSWALYLPDTYFSNQGFGGYNLSALYDAMIAPGAQVVVSQRNFIADPDAILSLGTGADLYNTSDVSLGTVPAYYRQPTNFALSAGGYLLWNARTAEAYNVPVPPAFAGVSGALTVGDGAAILADAGADVTLASYSQLTDLGAITAHGGEVDLTALISSGGLGAPYFMNRSVWLGSDAAIDVSGVALTDPYAKPVLSNGQLITPRSGKVLDGGEVSITGSNAYVVAAPGATINVSGAEATLDIAQNGSGLSRTSYVATEVASNAGAVTLGSTSGLYFDGNLVAHGGNASALGGTLTLLAMSGADALITGGPFYATKEILLQQSGEFVPSGLQPGAAVESGAAPSAITHFAADRLNGSGVDTLILGSDPAANGLPESQPVTIAFAGDVNLNLGRAVIANAQTYVALNADGQTLASGGTVSIAAPYVALNGDFLSALTPGLQAGSATLNIAAQNIDITGQLQLNGFANSNITAANDIRLYMPSNYAYVNLSQVALPGELLSAGDLTFKAAQLYPATGSVFIVDTPSAGSTITVEGNGASTPPISAGGALLFDAANIVQDGSVRAPSGTIQLGVGNASDPTTLAAFNNLPLVQTTSVTLGAGSLTSVSLDGANVPYGTTTDGTDWKLVVQNSLGTTTTSADLTGAPSKFIGISAANVTMSAGSTVDLSGGGKVYAQEWVPGTGGSRDLLNRVNTTYSSGATPTQTPLYADDRPIYAVIPGFNSPIAAYDPSFGYTGSAVGQSVYLSGVKGLPDGVYTLLPAQYATVPGAFRVVQQTGTQDSISNDNTTLGDSSQIVAGRFVDGITGKQASRTTSFLVQSSPVWQQYSQYNITSADTYFPGLAANAGTDAARTPVDAGQLAIAATRSLTLNSTMDAAAGSGGRGAEVDIAAQDIQITGGGAPALSGYLQLDATSLSNLGVESLLIGGTRSNTTSGVVITPLANSVVLSNDSSSALTGPEIILVAKTDPAGDDSNAANGLTLDAGSVISAKGTIATTSTAPILIGSTTTGASGDGALVRVSDGAPVAVIRANVPGEGGVAGTATGLLNVEAGATINGGKAATLDSSGALLLDPTAVFTGANVQLDTASAAFVGSDSTARPTGLVVGPALLTQLANVGTLGINSRGAIDFFGDVSLNVGQNLTLGANAFVSDGGTVSITAPTIALVNTSGISSATASAGSGSLVLNAGELDFGAGTKVLQGFGSVTGTATSGVAGQGAGSMDFGGARVTLSAPIFMADSGSVQTLTTTGAMTLQSGSGTALSREAMGGSLAFTGASVSANASLQALAGDLSLTATAGDVSVASGAHLSAAGVNKTFYDTTTYAPGGTLTLTADHGAINVASGAVLDVSGAAQGGDAGSLMLSAAGSVTLDGTMAGQVNGSSYRGGIFQLTTGGAVDLDHLAGLLGADGMNGAIVVTSGEGNLQLSSGQTLTARNVYLTANGGDGHPDPNNGELIIDGTIDISSAAAGMVTLYGKSGVDIEGKVLATSSTPEQAGGIVTIGTSGAPDGTINATYGYENVQPGDSGAIVLGVGALIDVSGGSADSGGTVSFRAPLLANGDVNITFNGGGANLKGARLVTIEPYAVWSTTDPLTNGAAQHFDGLIDPSGYYQDANGGAPQYVAGAWTDASGDILPAPTDAATLATYQSNDYFTPTTANADHQTFYGYVNGDATAAQPGTLMAYVEAPGYSFGNRYAGIANLQIAPGIVLENPDVHNNGGAISLLTNWNLGAGTDDGAGDVTRVFRYNGTAPILSVLAAGNLNIQASITDGFYQQNAGVALADPIAAADSVYQAALQDYQNVASGAGFWNGQIYFYNDLMNGDYSNQIDLTPDPYYQPLIAPLKGQTAAYYSNYMMYIDADWGPGYGPNNFSYLSQFEAGYGLGSYANPTTEPVTATAPQPGAFTNYTQYAAAYLTWLQTNFTAGTTATPPPLLQPILADNHTPYQYTKYSSDYGTYATNYLNYLNYVANVNGDITQGTFGSILFYQPFAPYADPGQPLAVGYTTAKADYDEAVAALITYNIAMGTVKFNNGGSANITSDPYYQPIQAPVQSQTSTYYTNYIDYITAIGTPTADNGGLGGSSGGWLSTLYLENGSWLPYQPIASDPSAPVAPQPGNYSTYAAYASTYSKWLMSVYNFDVLLHTQGHPDTPSPILAPLANANYTAYSSDYVTYLGDWKTDYLFYVSGNSYGFRQIAYIYSPFAPLIGPTASPSLGNLPIATVAPNNNPDNQPIAGNPIPLYTATLIGGSSSSYRLVAGADIASADPLAVNPLATNGSINLSGHLAVQDTATTDADGSPLNTQNANFGKTLVFPEVIRTGTGGISLAASGDIVWQDTVAPAAIYAAGEPDPNAPVSANATQVIVERPNVDGGALLATPEYLVSGTVNPMNGGNISLSAGGNILGQQNLVDTTGAITGQKGTIYAQYWTPWLQSNNSTDSDGNTVQTSINFNNFDQGVMSVGGNVSVTAGGDISELAVSLPTTWYMTGSGSSQALTVVGGGNLNVQAGSSILSGDYFVSKGTGVITAGVNIGSAFNVSASVGNGGVQTFTSEMAPLLGAQDTVFNVLARGNLDIGGVYNPSMLQANMIMTSGTAASTGLQTYSAASAVNLKSTGGDIAFNTLTIPGLPLDGVASDSEGAALPASFTATALQGALTIEGDGILYPSATSELSLIADGTVRLVQDHAVAGTNNEFGNGTAGTTAAGVFGMSDESLSLLASPFNPGGALVPVLLQSNLASSFQVGLHDQDTTPVRIYSLTGDVIDGRTEESFTPYLGLQTNSLQIVATKPAQIRAGRDIVSLDFLGQNRYSSDVTSVIAGRDIDDIQQPASLPQIFGTPITTPAYGLIQLAGPGELDVDAGRNLGPLTGNLQDAAGGYPSTGIQTIGNLYNPNLTRQSADISVLFGTGPGVAWTAFANAYLNPSAPTADVPSVTPDLIAIVEQYEADQDKRNGGSGALPTLSAAQAWAAFQTLPEVLQQAIVQKEFFAILQKVGQDYNDPTSPDHGKYARGYQAINTLFPASLGYTANNLEGGTNGAATLVSTGNLDIRGSTIQTQQGGGNIDILGPGGQLLIGSASSPPYQPATPGKTGIGPESQGVIAWETGAIDIYSDRSLLLAQSRIFTQQGGDMTIWSSNGDINAGKGAKTTVEVAPLTYLCDEDDYCRINSGQRVTGAGIAAFAAKPGAPPPTVTLVAPRGTVDAGDAGIRVAGDLIIAAQYVANADNIQVTGTVVGVPTHAVDVSANLSASNVAAAAAQEAVKAVQQARRNDRPSAVIVTIEGFGPSPADCDASTDASCRSR